jgi:hypothetical protein
MGGLSDLMHAGPVAVTLLSPPSVTLPLLRSSCRTQLLLQLWCGLSGYSELPVK